MTGAGGGIGYEAARALLWLGANVVIAEINQQNGRQAEVTLEKEFGKERVLFVTTETASKAVGQLAPQMGMSVEQFFEMNKGAVEHLDQVTRKYTRHPQYYGYIYPLEQRERETRIICRIHAKKITRDAIHR